jgi:hypothetical protein
MACSKQFIDNPRLEPTALWQQYTEGKQTYQQLAAKYNCSLKTIQRKIDAVETKRHNSFPAVVNVLMDTTYFGRKLGGNGFQRLYQLSDIIQTIRAAGDEQTLLIRHRRNKQKGHQSAGNHL